MAFKIDSALLIALVELRPVLWDKSDEKYKERLETKRAWIEVCSGLTSDYLSWSDAQQHAFHKEVLRRWTNIRDCYMRSFKKNHDQLTLRGGRKYVYSDQLQFLHKLVLEKFAEDNFASLMETSVIESPALDESAMGHFSDHEVTASSSSEVHNEQVLFLGDGVQSEQIVFKRPRYEEDEEVVETSWDSAQIDQMGSAQFERPQDSNMAFFAGILPHLKNFDEDDLIDFQMGVLQLITDIKRHKKRRK